MVDPLAVKAVSERIILSAGGRICDWLPHLDHTEMRGKDAIVGRSLVMLGLLNVYFKAPTNVIGDWLGRVNAIEHLSATEGEILSRQTHELSEQESINLYWYIEGLWTLMWVGSLIDDLPFDSGVEDWMASLTPNIAKGEDASKFTDNMRVRPFDDVFRMLDLYFRLHWYARDGSLNGYDTSPVRLDIIMERRKALEWVMDRNVDWDNVPQDT